jgi:cell division protein FtsB
MKKFRLADKRILWAGALVVLILLMMDFNNRLGEMLRLNQERQEVGVQVTQLVATQEYLKTQIAYATSAVAVQGWAREEGRMIQPGDIPIVPVAPPGSVTATPEVVVPTVEPVQNWQIWEALFFGE